MMNSTRFPHLMNASFLEDLPDDRKAAFVDSCSVRILERETALLSQGEHASGMFMIAHGVVEVSFLSEDGNKSIIYHAGVGDVLGAIETVAERDCAATCTAFANTTVLFCARPVLFEQLKFPVIIRNLAIVAHTALTRDNMFKSVDQFFTVEQRICMYLLQLSSDSSKFTQSQSYLANAVGCSRQTVNKELGRLRMLNIIDKTRGTIEVLDPEGLSRQIDTLDLSNTDRGH